ncbi:amino acid permease [soil metagenome]
MMLWHNLFRTKPLHDFEKGSQLKRCLTAFDLTLLGIGAIIGAGIFVLTGVAAATKAGPAITLSYVIAGLACAFSALCYAELASSIGGSGSAYGYAYASLGEFVAWIIGWDLLLEYGASVPTIAIGWSGYLNNMLNATGLVIPLFLLKNPFEGGIINLPAMLIVLIVTLILALGVRFTAHLNAFMVLIKLLAIGLFVSIAAFYIEPANWHPFMPFGWGGVLHGAAFIFFAYIGFDAVSTAAEETLNPQRNLPIGIISSLIICTVIYILVAGLLTAVTSYTNLNVSSPVAEVLLKLGHKTAAGVISVGAIAGLTTVLLVMFYGYSRVIMAMAHDGMLPQLIGRIDAKTQAPTFIIVASGIVMALIAGLTPIDVMAEMVNIGTLAAFAIVCVGVIVLHYTKPNMPRPFKVPYKPLFPMLGAGLCLFLMVNLAAVTLLRFIIWLIIGLVIYFTYSRFHTRRSFEKIDN